MLDGQQLGNASLYAVIGVGPGNRYDPVKSVDHRIVHYARRGHALICAACGALRHGVGHPLALVLSARSARPAGGICQ
jgi:hypothetical protein